MFRGLATNELYEDSIVSGLCKNHLKELQVKDESQRHDLQRKALLYMRLQVMQPLLLNKPFRIEKVKTVLDASGYFNLDKSKLVSREEFIDQILTLDSVVVFTLVKLCNICCAGALFRTSHRPSADSFFIKLLTQSNMETKDFSHFTPSLTANFSEYDEVLIKASYVAALIFVRNGTMQMNLRAVLDHQELTFQSIPKEGAQWIDVGSDAFKRQCYEEAVNAFNKAAQFNPYSVTLLLNRSQSYMKLRKFKEASLDLYMVLMLQPSQFGAYSKLAATLLLLSQFTECVKVAEYGLNLFKNEDVKCNTLEKIKREAINSLEKLKADAKVKEVKTKEKKAVLPPENEPQGESPRVGNIQSTNTISVPTDNEAGPLAFLWTQPLFHQIRKVLQQKPELLKDVLEQIGESNPQLLLLISQNQDEFMRMVHDRRPGSWQSGAPVSGRSAAGGGVTPAQISPQDREAIERDLPELVEASDSETECQDVPDLMDASNSDESDSEPEWSNSEANILPAPTGIKDTLLSFMKEDKGDVTSLKKDVKLFSEKLAAKFEERNKLLAYGEREALNKACQLSSNLKKIKMEKIEAYEKAKSAEMDCQGSSEKDKIKESATKTTRSRKSSVSDACDQKMDQQINSEKSKAKESATKTTRSRNSSVSNASVEKDDSDERVKMLQISLKDASNTLLDGCGLMAMRRFREALDEIKATPEIHKFEECDIICIKYAYAFACYQSGGYDDLQKAISLLQEITEEHKNTTFPAAYYTIGLAYHKLNRFKQAHQYFKMVDDILQKGIHANVYAWPGLTSIINETKLDFLKNSLPALIKECENPPPPDAICRYEGCILQTSIYYTDPDFKGFFTINCSEQCNLQYHPQCWKSIKISKNCSDKLFLEQKCFTPDCEGIIIKLQSISKEGNVVKEFIHADGKKSTKTKKSKLEKKLEIKEEKRRKRKDSSSKTESTSEVPEEIVNEKLDEPESVIATTEPDNLVKSETKDNNGNVNGSSVSQLPVNAEPLIVLKKEKFTNEISSKVPTKIKEHKKAKNNTFSIDEFLQHTDAPVYSNDYQQRLQTLRLNNQSWTDGIWSKSSMNSEKPMTVLAMDNIQPRSRHSSVNSIEEATMGETGLDDFPDIEIPKPLIVTECLKEKIYNYFREMLGRCGPLRVDDPVLLEKINSFPEDAKIIDECGGIGKFLQLNLEFAFVQDIYICLVEQLPVAYRKINEAALPIHDTDLKLSDNYESYDVTDKNSNEIFRFSSGLNPDAREYMPGTTKSSRLHSQGSVTEMDKQGRNSPELLSKIKLPLKIDKDNSLKKNELNPDMEYTSQLKSTERVDHSRRSSVSSTNSCSQNLIEAETLSGNKVTELVNTFKELIRMYYSEEMKEHRPYIDVYLKPYSIGCVLKKYTRSIQTEEIEKVSRGTMKTDDEIQELKDMTSQLIQDRKVLEQEYNTALECATKFQNKSNVEVAHLKKELEDKIASLDGVEKEFKIKEASFEKEVKILSENLKKIKVENAAQRKEMEKLMTAKESLLSDRAHLEEKLFSMQQEEQKLREDIDEESKLKSNIKRIEMEKFEADKRAKSAELLLLHLKKSEFLKRIDIKKGEAAKKIKEVQDGTAMFSGHLTPLYVKNIEELLTQIRNYLVLLEDIKVKFTASIDEQINEVNNGIHLSKLKPLEVQELPDIPIWNDQQMPSVFNSQPTWRAPQMANSLYNTGTFNPFSFAAVNPLTLKNNTPVSQKTNQDQKQQTPTQNDSSTSLSQPGNISVPPVAKAPPGLQNTITPSHHPPAKSMLNLNSSVAQSVVNSETKQKGASNSNVNTAATSASVNDGKVQFAYASAAVTPNVNTSEKKISASSLELDYKVKKNQPAENPMPLPNNSVPTTTVTESKKSGDKGAKKSFEKLLSKLQERFPKYSHSELMDCVKEFRTKRGSGLSGLSLDSVINSVGEIIEAKMRTKLEDRLKSTTSQLPDTAVKSKVMPNVVLVNKKLVAEAKSKEPPPPTRETSAPKKSAWGVSEGENSKQWNGSGIDEGCIICYEEMTYKTAYKVDCGHHFHFKCIKEWLDKKSDCPICRVHLLLPEDYPALS